LNSGQQSKRKTTAIIELLMFYIAPAKNDHNLEELEGRSFLKSFLSILPAADLGMDVTNATRLIFLYGATCNQEETKIYGPINKQKY
jgi:hypothetical protein